MTIHEATQQLIFQLFDLYEEREARNIAAMIMERITGWQKIDRVIHKKLPLLPKQLEDYHQFCLQLKTGRPVQYVLGECWFGGMPFFVDESVLIPRPETEELVDWIVQDFAPHKLPLKIIDIGTGSGCIPITLQKRMPEAEVLACDISEAALDVAKKNAVILQAPVQFIQIDFLRNSSWETVPDVDIVVSNPPYIPIENKKEMHDNVLAFEPHLALFVPDEDPFIFYKKIALFAAKKLLPGGKVYVEIHEGYGEAVAEIFKNSGFADIVVRTDLQGKQRMVKARRS